MSKKQKLLTMFKNKSTVTKAEAEQKGIENFRQQVYFLRKDKHQIINTAKREYKLLQ